MKLPMVKIEFNNMTYRYPWDWIIVIYDDVYPHDREAATVRLPKYGSLEEYIEFFAKILKILLEFRERNYQVEALEMQERWFKNDPE